MINVVDLYEDVIKDTINRDENGEISIAMFNRLSKRAELRLIDWLTGAVDGLTPPAPWLTQKNKDWLGPFITQANVQVSAGRVAWPADYYQYENFYRLGSNINQDCEDDENEDDDDSVDTGCNTPIEILDGQQYYDRCHTFIRGLKPSMSKPICKIVARTFEVMPADLGPVTIEYVRYPKFAELRTKLDTVYNEIVPDIDASTNYEWDEAVREHLILIITDLFFNSTREQAGKQFNQATAKTKP